MKIFMTSSPMGAYRSEEAPAFKGLDRRLKDWTRQTDW